MAASSPIDPLHLVVVEAFPERVVEADAEPVVDRLEGGEAHGVDVLPDGEVFRVAGLQLHQLLPRLLQHGRVGVGRGVADLVKPLELLERVRGKRGGIEMAPVGPDELAELRAPVADVVVADHLRATELEQPADGLADDGRAEMADMHLLRRVGRGVVHDPGLAVPGRGRVGPQVRGRVMGAQPGEERGGLEREIDEPGSGDGDGVVGRDLGGQGGHQLLRDRAGIEPAGLGVAEHAIGLEITVTRVGDADIRDKGRGLEPGAGRRSLEERVEGFAEIESDGHPLTSQPAPAGAQARSWRGFMAGQGGLVKFPQAPRAGVSGQGRAGHAGVVSQFRCAIFVIFSTPAASEGRPEQGVIHGGMGSFGSTNFVYRV